jgi:hypothetical protein
MIQLGVITGSKFLKGKCLICLNDIDIETFVNKI